MRPPLHRALDVLLAVGGLLLLSPFLLILTLLIRLDSPGPSLFRSRRVGKLGGSFEMFKFRTMAVSGSRSSLVTPDNDPRITRAGRWLRPLKMDELPQLINVLMGDMTFVGPRPQVPQLVALYSDSEMRILDVLPGITDPASLRFWNEGALLRGCANPDSVYLEHIHPEKIRLSLNYIERRSFFSDIGILFKTVGACFSFGGVFWTARSNALITRS